MKTLLVAFGIVLGSSPMSAQVVETPEGRVEFVGLKRWTVTMLVDSMQAHAPNVSLASRACAEVLRTRFGFPDAGVLRYNDGSTVIVVIEPGDSGRVQPRRFHSSDSRVNERWRAQADEREEDFTPFRFAVATYLAPASVRDSALAAEGSVDAAAVKAIWSRLAAEKNTGAGVLQETLRRDGNPDNRVMAATYLINFPERDDTWHALMLGMADEDGRVRVAARMTLVALREWRPRAIDWEPAVPVLRLLLSGTSVIWATDVQETLLATHISPTLSTPLLRDSYDLVLAQAAASHPEIGPHARALLTRLLQDDFGSDTSRWRRRLAELRD